MLRRIRIRNFKSIGDPGIDLELAPITILVGENGSGKSSILEGIYLCSKAVGKFFEEILRTEAGNRGLYPEHYHYKLRRSSWMEFGIYVQDVGFVYKYSPVGEPYAQFLQNGQEVLIVRGSSILKPSELSEYYNYDAKYFLSNLSPKSTPKELAQDIKSFSETISQIQSKISQVLRSCIFIPVSRLRFIDRDKITSDLRDVLRSEFGPDLIRWAKEFGLSQCFVAPARVGLEAGYVDPELDVELNVECAGYGSKQILSILIQLWKNRDSLILIEEPEISLHPSAQAKLAELFADCISKTGNQLIVTTHSDVLTRAFLKPVREGKLKIEQLKVYEITKDSEGTKARELELDPKGYIKGGIPSFVKVEEDLLFQWYQALPEEEGE